MFYSLNLKCFSFYNLTSLLKILFIFLSVFLFSSVSALSKIFLLIILFFIFICSVFLLKKQKIYVPFKLIILFFLYYIYLLLNTYIISEISFESKKEFLNYNLYILTFLIFSISIYELKILERELSISFLIILILFFIFFILYDEKIFYYFVYNPNIFIGYCLVIFLFSFNYIILNKKIDIFFLINLINLILSSLFFFILKNFTAILIIFIFLLFKYSKKYFLNTLILFFLSIFVVVYNPTSFLDRLVWNIVALKIWLNKFFFGIGIGNFKFYYQQFNRFNLFSSVSTIFAHNFFLNFLSETGIIGFLIFFLIFYFLIISSNFNKKFFYPVLGLMLHNFFDYNLIIPQNSILFYIFLSAICIDKKINFKTFSNGNLKILLYYIFLIIIFLNTAFLSFNIAYIDILLSNNKEKDLAEIVEIDKTCFYAWKNLAFLKFKENKFDESNYLFLEAIKYNPRDFESYLYLYFVNLKIKDIKKAYKFLSQAIILHPNFDFKKFFKQI